MARIRTVKPEFWTSEQIVECSIESRLLFIGLWNFVDDGGVMPLSLKSIKMKIFPGDDFNLDAIRRMIVELSSNFLLTTYEVDEVSYIKVRGWKHQKIDRPNFKFPQPCGEIPASKEAYLAKYSSNGRRTLDERSPPDSKGREGKGEEGSNPPTPQKGAKKRKRFNPPDVSEVIEYKNARNSQVDPQSFVDFYESKGWLVGHNKMKDWKAAFRNWEQRDKPKTTESWEQRTGVSGVVI